MTTRRQKRLWSILAILTLVAGSVGAMLFALTQNINLFYTPTQLVEGIGPDKKRPEIGQRLRIGGVVVEGSVVRDPESLLVRFDLVDIGPTVTVEYNGILPDLFREGQGIVAQGHLVEDRLIRATEVLARHDEEYMPPEVAKALKGIQHVPPSQQTATESTGGY
ncbi:cytochrome c maturation protein CcmE [Alkalimonas delamerensis]|uniref:Cytochrome c-type biogenesis protein CcmE n=1 Tax=Alkalimonas delamerensis TaxID=265981 RepID=A0ABT9GMQ5_9GAMM|nr:cytochrome c maturation protein CcmE [Alkalimonas delamerensis]MDP4528260.1 cytochrome c maturation protein CcmE [Alkalimonas delamerensis]